MSSDEMKIMCTKNIGLCVSVCLPVCPGFQNDTTWNDGLNEMKPPLKWGRGTIGKNKIVDGTKMKIQW